MSASVWVLYFVCNKDKRTSPLEMLIPKYISPNEPLPIFLTKRYLPLTRNSDFELLLALAILKLFVSTQKGADLIKTERNKPF